MTLQNLRAIGAFGVSWLVQALVAVRLPLVIFGAGFLLWMAWGLARAPLAARAAHTTAAHNSWQYFSTSFMLTLSNPATIISFVAIFGAMAGRSAVTAPGTMVLGVLLGSGLWWLLLSSVVGGLRTRFNERWRRRVNLCSVVLLTLFALSQLVAII